MSRRPSAPRLPAFPLPRAQRLTERVLSTVDRFIHVEAASGIVLLIAAAVALVWANSPWAASYHAVWHAPLSLGLGPWQVSQSLHFWINDALMTVFFLVVGMEIRREIHDGALANLRMAALPLAAALGGVLLPAAIFLGLNEAASARQGWAVPTATDIAFAVGVLALLGRSVPGNVRVLLLALAIIDDVAAVLIIAFFYSGGLDPTGLWIGGAGIVLVLALQAAGIASAWAYVLPGAILWAGMLKTGAHPTLAGVMLGLMTPVLSARSPASSLDAAGAALGALRQAGPDLDVHAAQHRLRALGQAQRDVLPPVTRVQMALHPWVAFGVMPLFALANAGVSLDGLDLTDGVALSVLSGVTVALVLGKPLGVLAASWLAVRLGGCRLPEGVTWSGIALVGLLAGIGFTMSIFIATLAFPDAALLAAAKAGVLLASALAAITGLAWGVLQARGRHGTKASAD